MCHSVHWSILPSYNALGRQTPPSQKAGQPPQKTDPPQKVEPPQMVEPLRRKTPLRNQTLSQPADSTHPTGMHTCYKYFLTELSVSSGFPSQRVQSYSFLSEAYVMYVGSQYGF